MNELETMRIYLFLHFIAFASMEHLRYSNESLGWMEASTKCESLNGSLLTITMETKEALLRCSLIESNSTLAWTGLIKTTSQWIEMKGYCNESQLMAGITIPLDENISPFACQQYCSEYEFFASHDVSKSCFCLENLPVFTNNRHEFDNMIPYKVFRIVDDEDGIILNDNGCDGRCHCVYAAASSDEDNMYATSCVEKKDVLCVNGERRNGSLSWDAADSFCKKYNSTLLPIGGLLDSDDDVWIGGLLNSDDVVWSGIRKDIAFVWSQYAHQSADPMECIAIDSKMLMSTVPCNESHHYICQFETENIEEIDRSVRSQDTTTSVTSVSTSDVPLTDEYVTANTAQTSDHTKTVDEFTIDYHSIITGTSQEQDSSTPPDGLQTSVHITIDIETTTNALQQSSHEKDETRVYVIAAGSGGGGIVIMVIVIIIIMVIKRKRYRKESSVDKPHKAVAMEMDVQSFIASYKNSTNNTTNNTNSGYDVHHMQINQGRSLYDDICEDSFVKDIKDNNIDSKRFKNSTHDKYSIGDDISRTNSSSPEIADYNRDDGVYSLADGGRCSSLYDHARISRDLQRSSSVENTYGCQSGIYNYLVHSDSIPTDHNEDIYDHIHDDSSEQQYDVARRGFKQNHVRDQYDSVILSQN